MNFYLSSPPGPWDDFWPKVLSSFLGSLLPFAAGIVAVLVGSRLTRNRDRAERQLQARKDYHQARLENLSQVLGYLYDIQSAALRAQHAAANKAQFNAMGRGTEYADRIEEVGIAAFKAVPYAERYGPLPQEVGQGVQSFAQALEQFFHCLMEGLNYVQPIDYEVLARSLQAARRDVRDLVAWEQLYLAEVTGDTSHLLLTRELLTERKSVLAFDQRLPTLADSTRE